MEKRIKALLANILVVELPLENLTSLLLFFNLDDCFLLRCLSVCISFKDINISCSFCTVIAIQRKGVQRTRAPTDIDPEKLLSSYRLLRFGLLDFLPTCLQVFYLPTSL